MLYTASPVWNRPTIGPTAQIIVKIAPTIIGAIQDIIAPCKELKNLLEPNFCPNSWSLTITGLLKIPSIF